MRRNLLILAGAALFLFALGMAVGMNTLRPLEEVLLKVLDDAANNKTIDPRDREELRLIVHDLDLSRKAVSGWVQPSGANSPTFESMRARQAEFDVVPLSLLNLESQINQSLTNSDYTVLSPTVAPISGSPAFFLWDSADPTKISVTGNFFQRGILVCGALDFAANATGRRGVKMEAFNSAGSLLRTVVMAVLPTTASGDMILPFSTVLILPDTTAYLKVSAYQNSGGPLNLSAYNISFMVVK